MSVFTLAANHNLAVAYTAPFLGPIRCQVEAEHSITVLIVDAANLAAWRAGQPYTMFAGAGQTQQFHQQIQIPSRTTWYLVMANFLTVPTAVYYNVQS